MGRLGTPADIGNAVSLLCSEEAGWITGQVIAVDGGSSLVDPGPPLEIQRGQAAAAGRGLFLVAITAAPAAAQQRPCGPPPPLRPRPAPYCIRPAPPPGR